MKFTTVIAALVGTAVAVPTGGSGGSCNNDSNQVCCNGGVLAGICLGAILSKTCTSESYCCEAAPTSGTINLINAQCIKLI